MNNRIVDGRALRHAASEIETIVMHITHAVQLLECDHQSMTADWRDKKSEEFSQTMMDLKSEFVRPCQRMDEASIKLRSIAALIDAYLQPDACVVTGPAVRTVSPGGDTPVAQMNLTTKDETVALGDLFDWFGEAYCTAAIASLAAVVDANGDAVGQAIATQWLTNIVEIFVEEQADAVSATGEKTLHRMHSKMCAVSWTLCDMLHTSRMSHHSSIYILQPAAQRPLRHDTVRASNYRFCNCTHNTQHRGRMSRVPSLHSDNGESGRCRYCDD